MNRRILRKKETRITQTKTSMGEEVEIDIKIIKAKRKRPVTLKNMMVDDLQIVTIVSHMELCK